MSYCTWHEYGYGIVVSDIITTKERVLQLVDLAPEYKKDFAEWMKENNKTVNTIKIEDLEDYEDMDGNYGIGSILFNVIAELDNIEFLLCSDYDNNQYLMYSPTFPWYLKENEHKIQPEDIETILKKYVKVLTNQKIGVCYLDCENGG